MTDCDACAEQYHSWPAEYTICVKGCLDPGWSDWLDGMAIKYTSQGETLLFGRIEDAPALQSLLTRIFDLNLLLLSVKRSRALWR